ncbi:ferritin-like domain-containing protein [Sorangium sp. So ce1151]|uniref:ferritin-like domain-containing protein n=1 Tax=Sorangium sp. So ce1151 TaxID=3133332 RepID=UPI003F6177B6
MRQTPTDFAIDFAALDPGALPLALVEQARLVWADRVRTEYQFIQIATRFLGEALAAGEPLDVARAVAEAIDEEIRHAELCGRMCAALGGRVPAPREVAAPLADLREVPLDERVLASAISLFLVAEAFSVGYLLDLEARADHPVTRAVLGAIAGDEAEHEAFGPELVARKLRDLPAAKRAGWRAFTGRLVRGHLDRAEQVLSRLPAEDLSLDRWPEPERATLGLLGEVRLALLCQRTYKERLAPTLERLGLG